ncbi:hypothetical protein ABH922_000393 [Rhodococcus sp. 27YEA15]|uniref:hypothetical protein n=1 Tax=Rhodococcus sp. 27YEA15 TaxID=3156259 RepID=UPI003C7D6520
MSFQTTRIDTSTTLSENAAREFGNAALPDRLNVLFESAAEHGTVLSGRQLSAVMSCSDSQWDMAGDALADVDTTTGSGARQVVLEWLSEVGDRDHVDVSGSREQRFMSIAADLSEESLALLAQACAHLAFSERSTTE